MATVDFDEDTLNAGYAEAARQLQLVQPQDIAKLQAAAANEGIQANPRLAHLVESRIAELSAPSTSLENVRDGFRAYRDSLQDVRDAAQGVVGAARDVIDATPSFLQRAGGAISSGAASAGNALRLGAGKAYNAVAASFDPGPSPAEMDEVGGYRSPLNTVIGGRMDPITAAGIAMLSAGEGMQGKPLSVLDMQKTGIARERERMQAQAAQHDNKIKTYQAQVAGRKEEREHAEATYKFITNYVDEIRGLTPGSEAYGTSYSKLSDAATELYGPVKGPAAASAFAKNVQENRAVTQDLLEQVGVWGESFNRLDPKRAEQTLIAILGNPTALKHGKYLFARAQADTALKAGDEELALHWGREADLMAMGDKPVTAAVHAGEEGKAKKEAVEGRVAERTEEDAVAKVRAEADTADIRVEVTRQERIKLEQEVIVLQDKIKGELKKDKRIASVFDQAMNMMLDDKNPIPLSKLPDPYRAVVKKVLGDEDLRTTMLEIAIARLAVETSASQAETINKAYKMLKDAEDSGDKNKQRIALNMLERAGFAVKTSQDLLDRLFNLEASEIEVGKGSKAPAPRHPASPRSKGGSDFDIEEFKKALDKAIPDKKKKNQE